MQVVLINKTHEKIQENEQMLQDHFARLGFSITKVYHDCLNSFLQTLPFGIGENWQILEDSLSEIDPLPTLTHCLRVSSPAAPPLHFLPPPLRRRKCAWAEGAATTLAALSLQALPKTATDATRRMGFLRPRPTRAQFVSIPAKESTLRSCT